MNTLPDLLSASADRHASRDLFPGAMTYGDLARRAEAVSRALAGQGAGPGRVLGLLAPNGPDWAAAFFGILGTGAAVLPLDPHLGPEETANLLRQFGVEKVLGMNLPLEPSGPSGRPAGAKPGDLAVLIASSGTTGKPKGVMLSHVNLTANVRQFREVIAFGPEDAILGLLPFHHAFPLTGCLLAAVSSGARVVVPESLRPPAILQAMAGGGVSFGLLVPGLLRLMAKGAERTGGAKVFGPALRTILVGGAPCPLSVLEACDRLGIPVLQGYGMSEASPVISLNTFEANRPGTVGKAIPGVEVRIRRSAEGEVLVRGPNVMMGYYRDPERTAEVLEDGWLCTGDIGTLDEEGFLTLRGRAKNVIISESGKNVYPEEVEAELARSELFKESCVIGKVAGGTERVVAVVVLQPGVDAEKAREEVEARCRGLADFKRPEEVLVWEGELPKTGSGKVKIAAVKERLS